MKIAVSTDHAGYEKLGQLKEYLLGVGHEVVDYGPDHFDVEDDYPDFIFPAAKAVAGGKCEAGIIWGGSGEGEAMVANRVKGVRCTVYYGPAKAVEAVNAEGKAAEDDLEILRLARDHNLANMLSLGARFLTFDQVKKAVDVWLGTPLGAAERHIRRVKKNGRIMADICPTVLATDLSEYDEQIKRVSFAPRIQLDFMDGDFAPTKSIDLEDAWWPKSVKADLHLMFRRPMDHLETIRKLRPNLVIVHAEAEVHHMHFAAELHKEGIKAGLCVLPETPIVNVEQILNSFDHLLIFGGHLGHFGGQADLEQLSKIKQAKEHHPDLEFGWDGGANDKNINQLVDAGINVVNVGGFIQKAEKPTEAYKVLVDLLHISI